MAHHRYIVATVDIKMLDPSVDPATSGPPDPATLTANIKDVVKHLTPTKSKANHKVTEVVVTATRVEIT